MKYSIYVLFLILLTSATAMAISDGEAARVKIFTGTASIIRQHQTFQVKKHDKIFKGDHLKTGSDGTLGIIFKDNTALSLGPRSEIVIDDFLFAPAQGKLSIVTRMLRGTAAYLSGVIVKLSPRSARFETPSATVGVRGTRFLVESDGKEME